MKHRVKLKTTNVKDKKFVLALNRAWMPVDIITYKDAFRLMCKGHAVAIDTNMESDTGAYLTHDMTSWMDLHSEEHYTNINTVSMEISVPEIIVLTQYDKVPKRCVKFSKTNLLLRDNFMCAYCRCEVDADTATIDHVHPQKLGGETSWTNCVIACKKCNNEKDCELPEGKYAPKTKPREPHHHNPIYHMNSKIRSGMIEIPESWKKALMHG
jgi:5-methylcytosine-specific restriction endonuclease McrA